jgi:hypothetical protein
MKKLSGLCFQVCKLLLQTIVRNTGCASSVSIGQQLHARPEHVRAIALYAYSVILVCTAMSLHLPPLPRRAFQVARHLDHLDVVRVISNKLVAWLLMNPS